MKISKKNSVAVILSLMLLTACGSAKTDVVKTQPVVGTQSKIDSVAVPEVKAKNLKAFVSKEGNFSIVFGGEPKVNNKSTNVGDGVSVVMYTFLYASSPTEVQVLAYTDMAPKKMTTAEIRDVLKNEESGVLASYGADKADEEKVVDYKGYPGFFYKAKTTDGVYIVSQTYYVDNRLFQMQISAPNAYPTDSEVADFIGSFKLLK